jgi:hypothetical protein
LAGVRSFQEHKTWLVFYAEAHFFLNNILAMKKEGALFLRKRNFAKIGFVAKPQRMKFAISH